MIRIEPITVEKVALYKSTRLAALQDMPTAFGSTYAKESQLSDQDWIKRVAQWNGERSIARLAMDDDQPCGIAAGFFEQSDPRAATLVSMWVAPSHRKLGVGRMLVDTIFNWVAANNGTHLNLLVTCSNDIAIRFYERLGFKMTGKTEPYPNDPKLIEYEMVRLVVC